MTPIVPSGNSSSSTVTDGPVANIGQPFELLYSFTEGINKFPGNRVFLETLTDYLITFDRLQFYFYHKQNLTQNSYALLANVNTLTMEKG